MTDAPSTKPIPEWLRNPLHLWDLGSLAERITTADTERVFPGRRGDGPFVEMLRSSVAENLQHMREYLLGTVDLIALDLKEPVRFARKQAEIGSSQNALQHSYRLGIQLAIEDWGAIVTEEGTRQGLAAATVSAVLLANVARMLEYSDAVQGLVAAEFADQEAELRRTGEQIREQIVLDLLNRSDPVATPDFISVLGYDLSHMHLAVQVSGIAHSEATRIAHDLRRCSGAGGLLPLRTGAAETVFWLGRPRSWPGASVEAILSQARLRGLTLSVTRPAAGLPGLRQTYRELAEMAKLRIHSLTIDPVLHYPDVRLDVLLLQAPEAARRFVEDELGPLAEDSPSADRLRQTVVASYNFGSHVQTAMALGVHEHTVRNRLRRAEELLGHSLGERRTELQIALRLRATMGRPPHGAPDTAGRPAERGRQRLREPIASMRA
ncbi:PucR family transcriptional regulator [Streptomyces sp. NPDC101455]|uniref:PucR family transcriptional regulator n=1 Tax=Streptomyces sp. NPDC101455 TaxID=3366142 RepID=UPI00382574AC